MMKMLDVETDADLECCFVEDRLPPAIPKSSTPFIEKMRDWLRDSSNAYGMARDLFIAAQAVPVSMNNSMARGDKNEFFILPIQRNLSRVEPTPRQEPFDFVVRHWEDIDPVKVQLKTSSSSPIFSIGGTAGSVLHNLHGHNTKCGMEEMSDYIREKDWCHLWQVEITPRGIMWGIIPKSAVLLYEFEMCGTQQIAHRVPNRGFVEHGVIERCEFNETLSSAIIRENDEDYLRSKMETFRRLFERTDRALFGR